MHEEFWSLDYSFGWEGRLWMCVNVYTQFKSSSELISLTVWCVYRVNLSLRESRALSVARGHSEVVPPIKSPALGARISSKVWNLLSISSLQNCASFLYLWFSVCLKKSTNSGTVVHQDFLVQSVFKVWSER